MTIAFFTEMGFEGKIPRNHPNMRTEFAWMCKLNADHYPLNKIPNINYDLGIVINSKKHSDQVNVEGLKKVCSKVGVMQEGPFWYFQDYPLDKQVHYFNNLVSADIIFVHNEQDRKYYKEWSKNGVSQFFDSVLKTSDVKPHQWFFGHHHVFDSWRVNDVDFYCCGKHGESWKFDKKTCIKFGSRAVS